MRYGQGGNQILSMLGFGVVQLMSKGLRMISSRQDLISVNLWDILKKVYDIISII